MTKLETGGEESEESNRGGTSPSADSTIEIKPSSPVAENLVSTDDSSFVDEEERDTGSVSRNVYWQVSSNTLCHKICFVFGYLSYGT